MHLPEVGQFAEPSEIVGQLAEGVLEYRRCLLRDVGKKPATEYVDEILVVGPAQIDASDLSAENSPAGLLDVRRNAQRVREVVGRSGRQHGYGQIEVPPFEHVDHVVDRAVPAGDEDMVVAAVDVVQQIGLLGFGERQTVGHDRVPSSLVDVDDVVEPVGDYRLARFRIVCETDFLHLFLLFACRIANFLPDYRAIVRPSSGVTYVWKRPCSSE